MHFCTVCHNMYYLKIRDEDGGNTLNYYCRNCGHEDTTLTAETICVSETQLRRSEQKYTHMVNEYTKFDPTLPRINTIKCPNQDCTSNGGKGNKVLLEEEESEDLEGGAGKSKKTEADIVKSKAESVKSKKKTAAATATKEEEEKEEEKKKTTLKKSGPVTAPSTATTAKNEHSEREVIYIRYDDINMKYVYLCVHCDTTWKTDNRL